jgi:hypothetical protein
MFKKVTKLLGAIALTGWMGGANATLIFDFSFGGSGNETIGEITGLVDNDFDQSATSIRFTKLDGNIVDFEFITDNTSVVTNSFNVTNNLISDFALDMNFENYVDGNNYNLYRDNSPRGGGDLSVSLWNWASSTHPVQVSGAPTFLMREVTVSEPGTVILLSLGLAGLSFARYRRQS